MDIFFLTDAVYALVVEGMTKEERDKFDADLEDARSFTETNAALRAERLARLQAMGALG